MRKCNAVTSFAVILIWTALLKIVCLLQWQHVVGSWRCCLSARTFGFEFTLAWSLWSVRVLPMSAWVLWLPPTVQWHGVRLDGDSKLALGVSVKTVFVPRELYRVDLPLRLCSVFRTADWDEMSTWYFLVNYFWIWEMLQLEELKGQFSHLSDAPIWRQTWGSIDWVPSSRFASPQICIRRRK